MPLTIFNHPSRSIYRERANLRDEFGHSFGGEARSHRLKFTNARRSLHLLYRLNLRDERLGIELPGIDWLPLVYCFNYAAYDTTLIYRMVSPTEIELIAPLEAKFDRNFPYENYPASFPAHHLSFEAVPYDPTKAEDALSYAAVFPLDSLSEAEQQRALEISEKRSGTMSNWQRSVAEETTWGDVSLWKYVQLHHPEPFWQGAPRKTCSNPNCTAEVVDRFPEITVEMPEELQELLESDSMTFEASDIRRDSMRVVALHEPEKDDTRFWGDPSPQLIFEICECCHCIRVSNQCD
jgi:hypothetical protein